jgi:hypothetical protein
VESRSHWVYKVRHTTKCQIVQTEKYGGGRKVRMGVRYNSQTGHDWSGYVRLLDTKITLITLIELIAIKYL